MEGFTFDKETPLSTHFPDVDMYDISGQVRIDVHDAERHRRNKEQDILIQAQLEKSLLFLKHSLETTEGDEQFTKMEQALKNPDSAIQKIGAKAILYLPSDKKHLLTPLVIENIENGLQSEDEKIQRDALEMIPTLPTSKRSSFITTALNSPDLRLTYQILYRVLDSSETEPAINTHILESVEKGLESPDAKIQEVSVHLIAWAPKEHHRALIKKGLKSTYNNVQEAALIALYILLSGELSEEEFLPFVQEAFQNPSPDIQQSAVRLVWKIPEKDRYALIKKALESPHTNVQYEASMGIHTIPSTEQESISELLFKVVQKNIIGKDGKINKEYARMSYHLPTAYKSLVHDTLEFHIYRNLESNNRKTQQEAIDSLPLLPLDKKEQLTAYAIKRGLGSLLVAPPLYKKEALTSDVFARKKFEKTGTETTLIGGRLKDKAIIRHLDPYAFSAWKKTYENTDMWKEAGFDYVPVEPILSYSLNKEGLVDVFSGVLDLSLREWHSKTEMFADELRIQKEKIIKTLRQAHVTHGHSHDGNFCLRFFRKDNGDIDFSRTPRLYIIDFDQALSL